MNVAQDPFEGLVDRATGDGSPDELLRLQRRLPVEGSARLSGEMRDPLVARLAGFDIEERPLLTGVGPCASEVVAARAAVRLSQDHVGRDVVVLFENGHRGSPIVVGVLEEPAGAPAPEAPTVELSVDGQQLVVRAERELVLRCGLASITLTRSGKVLIEGRYVSSRSSGYNKIKGSAVDIN